MERLAGNSSVAVVAMATCLLVQPATERADLPADAEVLVADSRPVPGSVYRLVDRPLMAPATAYARSAGGVHSVAGGPDGWVYFADGNAFEIRRTNGRREELVYRHRTYVRDLAFDSRGRLYFSEATGAGDDGTIYALDPAHEEAEPFVRVPLEGVDGSWAGHFAFDPDDALYLSTGNRVPAAIYAYVGGTFERRYSFNEPITGFVFQNRRKILFTNHRQQVYGLEGFSTRYVDFEHERFEWLNDITLLPDPPDSGPCSISGRLIGGRELWPITFINGKGPDLFWRYIDGTEARDDGTYVFAGLPRGHYWIFADIRADTARSFEPRPREVDCRGEVTGVDFTLE